MNNSEETIGKGLPPLAADRPMGIEVTQADRDAALAYYNFKSEADLDYWGNLTSQRDFRRLSEAFARHRQSSIASLTEGRADVDYWNSVAVGLGHESVCEALEALERLQSPPLTDAPDAVREALRELMPYAEECMGNRASNEDYMILCDQLSAARKALTTPPAKDDAGRLREAIELALNCTPTIRYLATVPSATIVYDCGNPWEILRAALSASDEGEERHG